MLSFCSNKLGMRSDAPGEYLFQYLIEHGVVPYLKESKQQQGEVWDHMDSKRKRYLPEYKLKVMLESSKCEMKQEEVCKKFWGVSPGGVQSFAWARFLERLLIARLQGWVAAGRRGNEAS